MKSDSWGLKSGAKAAMIVGLASVAAGGAHAEPVGPAPCQSYVGRQIAPVAFSDAYSKLPIMPRKDAYETEAQFQARLAKAYGAHAQTPVIVRKPWGWAAPYYRPETSELPFYPHTFGRGRINFGPVLRLPIARDADYFASAIAFEVAARPVETTTYETTNGFGAKVVVEKTVEEVNAIWERAGKNGDAAFVDEKRSRPLASLTVPADQARDIVEKGSAAFLLTPNAPFRAEGSTSVRATFRSPREKVRNVSVMYADVQCAFVLDGSDQVVVALAVR